MTEKMDSFCLEVFLKIYIHLGDINSRFDFNPDKNPQKYDESYSIAPPSYIKIVTKKKKKKKVKVKKVTRKHIPIV